MISDKRLETGAGRAELYLSGRRKRRFVLLAGLVGTASLLGCILLLMLSIGILLSGSELQLALGYLLGGGLSAVISAVAFDLS